MVYLENSSGLSLSDSNASTGENSRKTRQLTEESAEHLNIVSTTTNGTGDRHPEEKNPFREQENVKDKMGKVGVSEDTSTSTSNNAAVNLFNLADARRCGISSLTIRIFLRETKLEKQSAKTFVKFGAGEPIKTQIEKQNDKTVMPSDARVRHLKDQLIQGRVYLSLTATRNNPHFIRELRLQMKEAQRSLGEAIKDSELPRNSVEKLKALEQTLAKGKQIQDDCTAMRNFPNQEKLEDPRLYHYALFTDNILAAAVVVNSTISHAKVTLQNMFYGHLKCSILTGLLLFMMNNSPTTGSVTTTVAEKQRLASLVLLSIVRL
ncbi:unnamed protein product [Camellia sinensis]